ncbi:MAG TPA: glycosyltransferase family 1 protein [Gemmatimonadales bacterium]|jgi:glycosyltransferase involved in cell wall biosynthesis|nr:glycosyltransferase family 1 protein [Gemmatimonadales bacterium]
MRVAIFSEVYWPMVSGVGVTLLRLTRGLERRGHAVRVYTATYPLPPGARDRPEVHRSPSVPLFLYPDVQWAFPRQRDLLDDLAAFRPDVVHVATEFALGLAGVKAAQQLGVPIVASAHTDYHKYAARYGVQWVLRVGWIYLRWFYGHAHRVLAPSRVYERFLQSRGVRHTGIWTRGVDPAEFHPRFRSEAYRRALGLAPDDLLVTYVGRLAREKDLDRLIRAWRAVGARRRNARLVLVGRGPLEDELRRSGIPGLVVSGLRTGRALAEAYASADVFAFPSPTETFGNSLLEAMASGLPALAVRAGGVVEFAQHGVNAWLAPPRDLDGLTHGLARLLDDAELRARLRAGALATAQARQWDAIFDRLEADYRAAMLAGARGKVQAA